MTAPTTTGAVAARFETGHPSTLDGGTEPSPAVRPGTVLADLDAGRLRAAWPDPDAPAGWRVDASVKAAILSLFADRRTRDWDVGGVLRFRDRVGLPPKDLLDGPEADAAEASGRAWRIVPGGTSVRAGVHLGPGVVIMPPSFVNVGAWIGEGVMIDSHVLVGSCAQIGDRVHLAAGVQIGGVLEPPGARPVIVEDDAFVGAGSALLEGVLVRHGAVIGAGVSLIGTSRVYDLVRETILQGTAEAPLVIPAGAVVVPGTRRLGGELADEHGLAIDVALIVKDRDSRTDPRVALESALR
ncbi:MAG TPA: 2,3,4,5-tetrahydropyridine-2,6-dicarboxylate N-succinyltransferase [Candidatus Eisenbacteria bacterium]|nr:2,3,4,5-tetrahydropyridine-2,6-dicarboxylate N-succinyltransferase [Candidatus Eisenbacteria bacterium]